MEKSKMNLNPGIKGQPNKQTGKVPTPEETQAQFFADLGNALINMATFTGRMSSSLTELQKDFASHSVDFEELVALKKHELEKVHQLNPEEFPSMDEEGSEGEDKPDVPGK